MPKTTPYLGLPMKDPTTDGNDYFDVEGQINDPLEMLDLYAEATDNALSASGLVTFTGVETDVIIDFRTKFFFIDSNNDAFYVAEGTGNAGASLGENGYLNLWKVD
jgi:hypothetical protein